MAFQRPARPDIIARIFADISSRLGLKFAILRRSVVGVLSIAYGGAVHLLYGRLDTIAKEAMPDTAIDSLPRWAAIWNVPQKSADFAHRTVNFTGTINGKKVIAGSILNRSDGVQYSLDADVTIVAGVASGNVTAVNTGAIGNADVGVQLSLVNPVDGVSSTVTVAAGGADGVDIEDIEVWRARLIARIQKPPYGGNASDYERWALEVAGVTRAWVYPLYLGPGTVGIAFVRDNDASFIPDAGEVAAVQAYIDARRPVTATPTVFAPLAVVQNFSISGTFDAATKAAITAQLADFFKRESIPGGTLYLSRINEAIGLAQGETDHVLTIPAANVVRTAGQITTMGVITWLP